MRVTSECLGEDSNASQAERLAASKRRELFLLVEHWVRLLGRWQWTLFCTLTFPPRSYDQRLGKPAVWKAGQQGHGPSPETAAKAFRFWVSKMNRDLWGSCWSRACTPRGLSWVVAQEPHKSGRIHLHALLAGPGFTSEQRFRLDAMDSWWRMMGEPRGPSARLWKPWGDGEAVRAYCSKYVVKGGELELGGPTADERAEVDALAWRPSWAEKAF